MNDQQVKFFLERYSRMDDEELSHLIVTRGGGLSDEARHALNTVIRTRNPDALQAEMHATASDLTAQAAHAEQEAQKQIEHARTVRNAIRSACAIVVVAGMAGAVIDDSSWLWFSAVGVALFMFFEIRRLVGRFVVALFRMN